MSDAFTPQVAAFTASNAKNRETPPLAPGVAPTEDQNEQINLLATPLLDEVNSWSLSFVIGQKSIDEEWDNFVKACEGKDCAKLVELYNKAYKG